MSDDQPGGTSEAAVNAQILAELRAIKEALDDGLPIRMPSKSTLILAAIALCAIVPGGNAIAGRLLSSFTGAPTVHVAPPTE